MLNVILLAVAYSPVAAYLLYASDDLLKLETSVRGLLAVTNLLARFHDSITLLAEPVLYTGYGFDNCAVLLFKSMELAYTLKLKSLKLPFLSLYEPLSFPPPLYILVACSQSLPDLPNASPNSSGSGGI